MVLKLFESTKFPGLNKNVRVGGTALKTEILSNLPKRKHSENELEMVRPLKMSLLGYQVKVPYFMQSGITVFFGESLINLTSVVFQFYIDSPRQFCT